MPVGSHPTELVRPGRTYPLRRKDSLEGGGRREEERKENGRREEGGREGGEKKGGRREGERERVIIENFSYKPETTSPRVMFCCCSTIVYCWTSPL